MPQTFSKLGRVLSQVGGHDHPSLVPTRATEWPLDCRLRVVHDVAFVLVPFLGVGDAVPVDGIVIAGRRRVDQSMLTGESLPVLVGPGSHLHGGTCSVDARRTIRATADLAGSAAARKRASRCA